MDALPVLMQEYITAGYTPRQVAFSMFLAKSVQLQKTCRYLQEVGDIPSADIKSSEQMQYCRQWFKCTTFCWKEFENVIQLLLHTNIVPSRGKNANWHSAFTQSHHTNFIPLRGEMFLKISEFEKSYIFHLPGHKGTVAQIMFIFSFWCSFKEFYFHCRWDWYLVCSIFQVH